MIRDFIHDLALADVPAPARKMARVCLLDTLAVAAAGSETQLSRIIRDHAAGQFGAGTAGGASLWFDGRRVSPAGAALANGMTIDSVDGHDGWAPSKGHAGCHVVPGVMAFGEAVGTAGADEALVQMIVGYEIGLRVAIAQHRSVPDYHASGSWGAVGVAALGARALGLDEAATREALGIAEYHGPRSQMLRVTTTPTMLKDSSGWGAMCGVSAAWLAKAGFTGAPAVTVEAPEVADVWADLGSRWLMAEQYIKPYPTCRWSHAPIRAALELAAAHGVTHDQIGRVEVASFAEMLTLGTRRPRNTEEAQYSTPFPVAVALVTGGVHPADIDGARLADPDVLRLADGMAMVEDAECNAGFPEKRQARVAFEMKDGRRLEGPITEALGAPDSMLSDPELRAKVHAYADPVIGRVRAEALAAAVDGLADGAVPGFGALLALLLAPGEAGVRAAE